MDTNQERTLEKALDAMFRNEHVENEKTRLKRCNDHTSKVIDDVIANHIEDLQQMKEKLLFALELREGGKPIFEDAHIRGTSVNIVCVMPTFDGETQKTDGRVELHYNEHVEFFRTIEEAHDHAIFNLMRLEIARLLGAA